MTFWTPEIVPRLDQLRKSVGSFGIVYSLGWVLGGLTGTISSWADPEKTTGKKHPKKVIFGYQDHQFSARPLLYFLFMEEPKLKALLIFKMMICCWDTRVQSYPTSASKVKSTNCSACPLLYFLFMADRWNLCGTFLRPYTKSTFLFFKILIRYWDTGYLTSASKMFGVARKRRVPAEKC